MKTLKVEEVDGSAYRDIDDARGRIGEFIERVYNRQRLRTALRYYRQRSSKPDSPPYPQLSTAAVRAPRDRPSQQPL